MSNHRQMAESYLREGVTFIGVAFDCSNCRHWRFDSKVQDRATELLAELVSLFKNSPIRGNLDAPSRSRSQDPAFADFIYALTAQAKDGSFIGRRAFGHRRRDNGEPRH